MTASPEQFVASSRAAIDSLLSLSTIALDSAERVAALNLNTVRSVLEDSVANAQAVIGVKDPQEVLSLQASLAQPSVEKAVAYTRSVYEITDLTKDALVKQLTTAFTDWQKQSTQLAEKLSKSAPVGSDVAVAAVRSAIAATNATVKAVGATVAATPKKK